MRALTTPLPGVVLLEPKIFGDDRGFFLEYYNRKVLAELGIVEQFVQDNHSRSARNVLRGLHYQLDQAQGKLLRVTAGEVFDVSVDLRRSSSAFGRWFGTRLSADNKRQLWIPKGFAHGFLVLSDYAEFMYKVTDYYNPAAERTIVWNSPDLGIKWPLQEEPILSTKDKLGVRLSAAEVFP
jgi:dTDP-4-dehydrorhamnose 3,5-epimerase